MRIVKVELENVKNYEFGEFEFGPGLIAICGPNGAGKTTILQAIAWALFDTMPYKKYEDFIRRGAKRGSVKVTFTSSADGREYVVYRDTSGKHCAYDPSTGIMLLEGNKQVLHWIKEQLGIDPATNLETLFEEVVGVPQGTLTVSFSKRESDRKKDFDKILRVDEYSKASEGLKPTIKLLESKIAQTREEISRIEERVSALGQLILEYERTKSEIPELENRLEVARRNKDRLREKKDRLEGLRRDIEKTEYEERKLSGEIEQLRQSISKLSEDLQQCSRARQAVEAAAEGFAAYNEAKARLDELLLKQSSRDELNRRLAEEARAIWQIEASLQKLREKLDQIKSQEEELSHLTSLIEEQEQLEGRANKLRSELGGIEQVKDMADSIQSELEQLRASIQQLDQKIAQAESARAKASELGSLRERHQRARDEFTKLTVGIEQDRKFLSSISGGLCPLLQEKCLNMKEGQTLDQYVRLQIENRNEELAQLELERRALEEEIKEAEEAERVFALLPVWRARKQEAEQDRERKEATLSQLQDRLSNMDRLRGELREVERQLKELGDPRGRASAIRDSVSEKEALIGEIERGESQRQQRIAREMELKSRLEEMADLEGELRLLREQLKQCEADHKIYLENKALADEFESRAEELDRETRRLEEKQRERDELVSSLATLKSLYDEAQYESAKRDWEESIREEAMLGNDLKRLRERAEDLGRQIEALRESEQQLESLRASKGRLESLDQLSKFVCELLKQAGPYIAESIVRSISVEANRLYRDITGNQNVTLHWSYENEYEIVLEEDGYERGFANLSGGEQMAAALSVRLALLKELSDLRIAFFDEPTANLDEQRRRQLAEEIGRITDFDQLFIISHDDAFESFTHQVVRVPNRSDISLEGWQGSAD